MQKWTRLIVASLILVMLPWTTLSAQAQSEQVLQVEETVNSEVKLTKEQQKELENISKQILEKRIEMINKYVEYGVIPKNKAKKIIKHMEKHHEKSKENGYIPQWDKHKKKHRR